MKMVLRFIINNEGTEKSYEIMQNGTKVTTTNKENIFLVFISFAV